MKKITIISLVLILMAVVMIVLNYDNILKLRYDNAVKNKDCEKIYELINIEEGKYLTKEKFINQCKINIDNYRDYTVEVEEHKIKNNLVKIYNNTAIYFPSDSKLYIDDKLIDEKIYNDEKNIYKIYKIEKLYEGEYNIKFKNENDEENTKIIVSNDDTKEVFEYSNSKQTVVVIGSDTCGYCRGLLNFLDTLDKNIFEVKYYNIYKFDTERVKLEFKQHFNEEVKAYPTVIIGNTYKRGYGENLENEYIEAIYHAYRNEIKTIIN